MRTLRRAIVLVLAFGLALLLVGLAQASCGAPVNAVEAENCLPGTPQSTWDTATRGGDSSIQGFATDISVNVGGTMSFKINTPAAAYHLDIYRLGWYGGNGARLMATIRPSVPLPQVQPACLSDPSTGLIDCGNWAVSASWTVPASARSGVYIVKATRDDTGGASHLVFIVRNDASRSDILMQTSDTTWEAYNSWGGNSFYLGRPAGRAYKLSYNRPFITRVNYSSWVFSHEYPMLRWLEANAYDVTYASALDTDRNGSLILNHRLFMSVGHDEYWSGGARANVETARAAGVNLGFFSGNEIYWKARWEPSLDSSHTPFRTLVCYKESYESQKIDPTPAWTGTWRDPRGGPPYDAFRAENALTGTIYSVAAYRQDTLHVPSDDGQMRFWRNTSVARLPPGQEALFPELLGYEWDTDADNGFRPAGLFDLSKTRLSVPAMLDPVNNPIDTTGGPGVATHRLTLYRAPSGALVFGSGTMQWPWGLDDAHDNGSHNLADSRIQQATVNLLADMGIQPGALQSGLTPASASTDHTPPTSQITSPANGSTVQLGTQVTIAGTASDAAGQVAAVEVSVDAGTTWHPATGRTAWQYNWRPVRAASVIVKTRAVDDSGNLETAGAGIVVNVGNKGTFPVISGIAPVAISAGSPGFLLTVQGANFTNGSTIAFGNSVLTTTFLSPSQLSATVSAALIASPARVDVTVRNAGQASGPVKFTITNPAAPTVTGVSPSSATVGSRGMSVLITGQNFTSTAVAFWNDNARPTQFVDTGSMRMSLASADFAKAGIFSVTVRDLFQEKPAASLDFVVFDRNLPAPVLTSLSPASAAVGTTGFTLHVIGTNFMPNAVVLWNSSPLPTVFSGPSQLNATVSADQLASPGTVSIRVSNPAVASLTRSDALSFQIVPRSGQASLSGARVYPNPWRSDRNAALGVTFDQLATQTTADIFTLSGRWVRRLGPADGTLTWDLKNDAGQNVASGYYLYLLTDPAGDRERGKLMVIR